MAEISPPEFRGALMAMEQFSIVLGCVLGFWVGFFTRGGMSYHFSLHRAAGLCIDGGLSYVSFDPPHTIHDKRAPRDDDPARWPIVFLF